MHKRALPELFYFARLRKIYFLLQWDGMAEEESTTRETERVQQGPYMVPLAIVLAGVMVAGAVIYSRNANPNAQGARVGNALEEEGSGTAPAADNIRSVNASDHIRGNPEAPVKIVEFSDLECPFCKRFHETMQTVMAEYGKDGKVAWVYRHFPLTTIHPKALKEAEASECAATLGDDEKFWAYVDRLLEITPSNNGLDLTQLPQIAQDIGLDRKRFEACLTNSADTYAQRLEADYQDAVSSGGTGTPYSVAIAPNGKKFVISGAQTYAAVKQIIEAALAAK
jgi:protein-disulfide isomerase